MTDWLNLSGRIAVVTGAAGGLGRAIAAGFSEAGCQVALLDKEAIPGPKFSIACDVTHPESVTEAADKVHREFGGCDVLVNNAGVLRAGALDTLSLADWNNMLAINLTGYFQCSQAFGRDMLKRGRGSIVHIASIAASHPQGGSGAYSASKAAVVMLAKQLATEWGPRGVRSNVVSPGLVRTPMSEPFYTAPGVLERRTAVVPARRIGTPADIADAVLFLASDRASYITGDEITVDGGFTRMVMNLIPRPSHD